MLETSLDCSSKLFFLAFAFAFVCNISFLAWWFRERKRANILSASCATHLLVMRASSSTMFESSVVLSWESKTTRTTRLPSYASTRAFLAVLSLTNKEFLSALCSSIIAAPFRWLFYSYLTYTSKTCKIASEPSIEDQSMSYNCCFMLMHVVRQLVKACWEEREGDRDVLFSWRLIRIRQLFRKCSRPVILSISRRANPTTL